MFLQVTDGRMMESLLGKVFRLPVEVEAKVKVQRSLSASWRPEDSHNFQTNMSLLKPKLFNLWLKVMWWKKTSLFAWNYKIPLKQCSSHAEAVGGDTTTEREDYSSQSQGGKNNLKINN